MTKIDENRAQILLEIEKERERHDTAMRALEARLRDVDGGLYTGLTENDVIQELEMQNEILDEAIRYD